MENGTIKKSTIGKSIFQNGIRHQDASPLVTLIKFSLSIILAGSALYLVYMLSLGVLAYIIVPILVIIAYTVVWLSLEISRQNKNQIEIYKQIGKRKLELESYETSVGTTSQKTFSNNYSITPFEHHLSLIKKGHIELYVSYKKLTPDSLVSIIGSINELFLVLYGFYNKEIRENFHSNQEFNKKEFFRYTKEYLKNHQEDIIRIYSFHTGSSFKVTFGPGWEIEIGKESIPKSVTIILHFLRDWV